MANKTSNLNLVKANQAQKEVVINNNANAMSPSAFGGKNDLTTNGLQFGLYGGYRKGTEISNAVITLPDATTNIYVYFNDTSKVFEYSTTGFGDFPCYLVTTSSGMITDWKERRDGYSGGSDAGGDPNFVGNNTPSTLPKTTQTDAIAIGNGSEGNGYNSFAAMTGKATGQHSIAFGQSNVTNANFAISFGGSGNYTQAERSAIFSGRDNIINGASNYNFILNSQSCTITYSAYDYNTIISSNHSAISSNNSIVINGYNSYIEIDGQYSYIEGRQGKVDIPFTKQQSFNTNLKSQKTGLNRETTSTTETPLQLGGGLANVKNFKLQENQVVNIEITLLGCTSSGDVILFKDSVLVKRFSGTTEFVGESSTTEKILTLTKSSSALNTTTARIIISSNDIIIGVTPNISSSIQWSCEFDQVVCQRS